MMFMACSLAGLVTRIASCSAVILRCERLLREPRRMLVWCSSTILRGSPCGASAPQGEHLRMTAVFSLNPRHIELRLLAGAVAAQRAVFANRVGALEDPVLPRRQAREDFRFHGVRPDEAPIGVRAGAGIGREAGAFLEERPDLVIPVDIVEGEGDEAEL